MITLRAEPAISRIAATSAGAGTVGPLGREHHDDLHARWGLTPVRTLSRHAALVALALFLAVATVDADDLEDQSVLATIEGELQTILDSLATERRKPLAEQQDAPKVADLVRHVDGVRQRLAQLQPLSPVLRTRKINMEADLDRLTYLANDPGATVGVVFDPILPGPDGLHASASLAAFSAPSSPRPETF